MLSDTWSANVEMALSRTEELKVVLDGVSLTSSLKDTGSGFGKSLAQVARLIKARDTLNTEQGEGKKSQSTRSTNE